MQFAKLLRAPDGTHFWHHGPKPAGATWPAFATEREAKAAAEQVKPLA